MLSDLSVLLPETKMDIEKAKAIVSLGFPAIAPILPAIMAWMQDINWPVARIFQPFLVSIGAPLAPHIRKVLEADDEIWKYWVLQSIVAKSDELGQIFVPELRRLANHATPSEHVEELDVLAQSILKHARY